MRFSNFFDINGANSANYQPAGISSTTLFRRNVIISSDTTSCTFIGDDIVTINKRNTFDINLSTNDPSDTFCQDQNIIVSANTGAATYTFIVNATTISSNTTTNTLNLRSGATRTRAATASRTSRPRRTKRLRFTSATRRRYSSWTRKWVDSQAMLAAPSIRLASRRRGRRP